MFEYKENDDFLFELSENDFVTIMGNGTKRFLDNLMYNNKYTKICGLEMNKKNAYSIRKKVQFVLNKHINVNIAETVGDEIAFGLESRAMKRNEMIDKVKSLGERFNISSLLDRDPNSLGSSDKAKVKIISALVCKPRILIINNILCELDLNDKKIILDELHKFLSAGNIIINITDEIEESLYGNKIIVLEDDKLIIEGDTLSVLSEEKLMKRLGLFLPFMMDLNVYLKDYNLIDKYNLDMKGLVDSIWK